MWTGEVDADGHGIVLFDPNTLATWRSNIPNGADLFAEFISSESGDEVLRIGAIVPVLAIDDDGYDVIVRLSDEPSPIKGEVIAENGDYALCTTGEIVLADLAVLRSWYPGTDWIRISLQPGKYAVRVRAFREINESGTELVAAGYEFVLTRCQEIPTVTANTGRNMRTINWWDEPQTKD